MSTRLKMKKEQKESPASYPKTVVFNSEDFRRLSAVNANGLNVSEFIRVAVRKALNDEGYF